MLGRVLTKTAALEQGARGVRVNACCPGPIAGRMTFKLAEEVFTGSKKTFAETVRLGRHGTPEDVAGLVSYLRPMIPAMRQAPHTLSTAASRQPDRVSWGVSALRLA